MDSVQFNGYFDAMVLCTNVVDLEKMDLKRGRFVKLLALPPCGSSEIYSCMHL